VPRRIYISSTFKDLEQHRAAVHRQLRLAGYEVVAMEDYVATDERPVDKCLADVSACDTYVGIFAQRYGYVPAKDNSEQLSITELEYRKATAAGKPRFVFLLAEDAKWSRTFDDAVTRENDPARIAALRAELKTSHGTMFFETAEQLALQVTATLSREDKREPTLPSVAAARPDADPQFRDLGHSVFLAFAPQDARLAQAWAIAAAGCVEKPVLFSKAALFADGAAEWSALDASLTRCEAALVLLARPALDALRPRADAVARVLEVMKARVGDPRLLLCGVTAAELPPAWRSVQAVEAPTGEPAALGGGPAVAAVTEWLQQVLSPKGSRSVGLPISIMAMTAQEAMELKADPSRIGGELGEELQKQFEQVVTELAKAHVPWETRYGATRDAWQPFGPVADAHSMRAVVDEVVRSVNALAPAKLRQRSIRPQWYPFDPLVTPPGAAAPALLGAYEDVARTGCVLVVDELSLFEPRLLMAFTGSPFFNSAAVAMVTVSPFDPQPGPIAQVLEQRTQKRLVAAFQRYATKLDPHCELAIADERRLKRWLHASVPETVTRLRELQPARDRMEEFYQSQGLGLGGRTSGDYPWGGGSRT
jgi:hypothetical protein